MENELSLPDISVTSLELLGIGVSGHVFAIDEHTVLKKALITGDAYTDRQSLHDHLIERQIYERLGEHHRICRLQYRVKRGLVLERLKESLRKRLMGLQNHNELPPPDTALRWSIQTAEGFAYIHSKDVLQGDIGCHNLLLDNDDNVKLCDFAGSSLDGSNPYVGCGKGFRRPSEDPDRISMSDELFALGSTIYEIWTTRKPYQEEPDDIVDEYFRNEKFPEDLVSLRPARIITQCWRGHYISAAEVVADLKSLNKDIHKYSWIGNYIANCSTSMLVYGYRVSLVPVSAALSIFAVTVWFCRCISCKSSSSQK
jgi:serine/threonine protein kinase